MVAADRSATYQVFMSQAARALHNEKALLEPASVSSVELTAFVSCYNESEFITQTLDEIRLALYEVGKSFEIIVIDDYSKDDSAEKVRRYIAEHPQAAIVLRRNLVNKGLAQNYIDGAFLGKGRYYKLFCGDNTEPRERIIKTCALLGSADMIIPNYSTMKGKNQF